tara:strand:- start:276 stop:1247 length:972 start_codon:yes stop_codon:yes gene_type:complete
MNKVLITGACGFIGSHLVEYFVNKKIKVIAYDKYNSKGDFGWLEENKKIGNTKIILGDIKDYSLTNKLIKESDYIIHLAALISIPYSYFSPGSYIKTNVEGTYNILESARLNRKRVIITSTSEVYGTGLKFPMNEKHPIFAQSPYAASKIAADNLALSYYNTFNLPIKIIRPFNAFGPRQSNRAIIPTVISQLLSKKKNIKVGNIYPKRDWTYVSDLCSAYYALYKSRKGFGKIYNVGTGNDHSISDMIKISQKICKTKKKIILEGKRKRPIKSEVNKLQCDSKFFKRDIGWSPKIHFKKGLNLTIEWIKKNSNNKKSDQYQI